MKKTLVTLMPILALVAGFPPAHAEDTRVTNPNALSVEILGRGGMYSIDFDRVLDEHLVAGLGFGSVSTQTRSGASNATDATLIPVYVNYNFTPDQGSFYATGGATVVSDSSDVDGLQSTPGGI